MSESIEKIRERELDLRIEAIFSMDAGEKFWLSSLKDLVRDIVLWDMKNHNSTIPSVWLASSEVEGKWVFALENIEKGSLITKFGWNVTPLSEWLKMDEQLRAGHIMIGDEYTIGASSKYSIDTGDFVNHSCNPSCAVQWHLDLIALRDIYQGEEITFDYGTVIWGIDIKKYDVWALRKQGIINSQWEVIIISECKCGSENCREYILANDWETLSRREEYRWCFPHHIQKLIDISRHSFS